MDVLPSQDHRRGDAHLSFDRSVYCSFYIDANKINARGTLESMNQLERWAEDEIIHLGISEVAKNEAARGSTARWQKAVNYIYTLTYANTPDEAKKLKDIENVIFPDGACSNNQRNDVEVVFNAWKYCGILVTADGASGRQPGGILGNRDNLEHLGIMVMSDGDAVEHVRQLILNRDNRIRKMAEATGASLPDWVGQD